MRVPAEKPEAFRTAGGGAADSGLEQQDACKDQTISAALQTLCFQAAQKQPTV
jgi:hypothetical protein